MNDVIDIFRQLDLIIHDGTSDLLNHPSSESTVILEIHHEDGRSTTLVDLLASSSSPTTASARELSSLFSVLSSESNFNQSTLTKVLAPTLMRRPHCHILVCIPDVKGRESDIAEGLRYPFSLLPMLDRSEGLKDRKERNLTQVMRDCRETLDRMSSEGLGGGLTPKASVSRRQAFEENVKSLAGVRKEVRIMMGLCGKHYYPNFPPPR